MSIISSFISVVKQNSMNYRDKEVDKPLLFRDCVIKDVACFQYSTLRKHVKFEHCTFNEDVVWGNEKERETSSRAEQDIVFHDCTFRKRVLMDGIECGGGIYFKDCHFEYESTDEQDYSLSISGGANIQIGIEFDTCDFRGGINLNATTIFKLGCFFYRVNIDNEKCILNFIAANFAKELSFNECYINCNSIIANCAIASHILIGTNNQRLFELSYREKELDDSVFYQEQFVKNKDAFSEQPPKIVKVVVYSFFVHIITEHEVYMGIFTDSNKMAIVKANMFRLQTVLDFSYSKLDDKFSIGHCIIQSNLIDISNICTRDIEIFNSLCESNIIDFRHLHSGWIFNIHHNVIETILLTFNGLTCNGGLFMNNIKYLQKQETNEDYGIDLSFSHYGINLDINNILLDYDGKEKVFLIIKFQSSKIANKFICNNITTADEKHTLYLNMQSMDIGEWEYTNKASNVLVDVNNTIFSAFKFAQDEDDSDVANGYQFMSKYIVPESILDYLKNCEKILRNSDKTKNKADEIRRKRINNLLEAKYSGAMLSIIKVIYRLTDYGLSNKSLISHACLAIICMGIINICFSVNHFDASSLSWENTFLVLKAFLQSFIDFFPMIDTATDGDSVIILGKIDNKAIYNCILFPYKVYGFFLISILIASISGVFQPRND